MSALNVFVGHDRILLCTDTAVTNSSGTVTGFMSKVRRVPALGCVIAIHGWAPALSMFEKLLPGLAKDLEGLHAAIQGGALRRVCRRTALAWRPFVLVVAGQTRAGPKAFYVSNRRRAYRHKPVWTAVDIPSLLLAPSVGIPEPTSDQPYLFARTLLDAQRRHLEPSFPFRLRRSFVGGKGQATVVQANGTVETQTVVHWPDSVGRLVGGGEPTSVVRCLFSTAFGLAMLASAASELSRERRVYRETQEAQDYDLRRAAPRSATPPVVLLRVPGVAPVSRFPVLAMRFPSEVAPLPCNTAGPVGGWHVLGQEPTLAHCAWISDVRGLR